MKTKVDKQYTLPYQMNQVKADLAEFKERYTDNDLIMYFADETGRNINHYGCDIIRMDVEGFPAGSYFNDVTHFHVEAIIETATAIHKVSFYTDIDMNITLKTMFGDDAYILKTYELINR